MGKFSEWLSEHIIELVSFLAATGLGGAAVLSFSTYIREFWERNPIITAFYSLLCLFFGMCLGALLNLSKYLIWKNEIKRQDEERDRKEKQALAEKEAKRLESERIKEEQLQEKIKDARERIETLSPIDKYAIKVLSEKGLARVPYDYTTTHDEFTYVDDLVNITETNFDESVITLTNYGKFCVEHSQDILEKAEKPKTED